MTEPEEFHAAAAKLREAVQYVGHIPVPWVQPPYPAKQGCLISPNADTPILLAFWGGISEYVATLHPAVPAALADWLDHFATTRYDPAAGIQVTDQSHQVALAVVRAINTTAVDQ